MNKDELKRTAEQLATCEIMLRQCCEQSEHEKLYHEYATLLQRVNMIRSNIPELAEKRYWWDVPFKAEDSSRNVNSITNGIYSEQASLNENDCFPGMNALVGNKIRTTCSDVINYRSSWKPLYLNKTEMRNHLNDKVELRAVYFVSVQNSERVKQAYHNDFTKEQHANAIRDAQRQAERIDKELSEKLEKHNNFWDNMERWSHGSFFTNEQRWLMGQMDTLDYFEENAGRFLRQRELEHKAWEEQAELEYQLRRVKNLENLAIIQEVQSSSLELDDNSAKFSRVAEIVYCGEILLAIYLPPEAQSVYEITSIHAINPFQLEGKIGTIRELYTGKFDYKLLFCFLTERYASRMKQYSVLSAKPKGLSDDEWRAWAEIRWTYRMVCEER